MNNELLLNDHSIPLDKEGYLRNLNDWNPQIASQLANLEEVKLTELHWEIIELLRNFYQQHQLSPANRALVNLVKRELGAEKGKSAYLMKLFGGSPAKTCSKLAGLPKPDNCL